MDATFELQGGFVLVLDLIVESHIALEELGRQHSLAVVVTLFLAAGGALLDEDILGQVLEIVEGVH